MVIIHRKGMFYLQLLPKIMVTFIKKLLRDEKCWRKNHLPAKEKFQNWAQSQLQEFHSQLQNSNPAPEIPFPAPEISFPAPEFHSLLQEFHSQLQEFQPSAQLNRSEHLQELHLVLKSGN